MAHSPVPLVSGPAHTAHTEPPPAVSVAHTQQLLPVRGAAGVLIRPNSDMLAAFCSITATSCRIDFADSVFHLVKEKFRSLVGGCGPALSRHKSLAGIVMTRGTK
uniref:Uncharacterized protein n=1 Tax=Knipowitschia caucasica TaxID=637954 RepID=A0AAV2L2E1_KNICA